MHVYVCIFICTPHISAHFLQQSALIECIHHRSSDSFCFSAEELGRQLKGKSCCSLNTASPLMKCWSQEEAEPGLQQKNNCLLEVSCSTQSICALKMQFSVPICRQDGAGQLSTPARLGGIRLSWARGWGTLS